MTFPLYFPAGPAVTHDFMDRAFDAFTMASWINVTGQAPDTSYAAAAAMLRTPAQNSPTDGAVGVQLIAPRKGRPYFQPGYSLTVGRCPTNLINQGWTHLAVRAQRLNATQFSVFYYINGAPVYDATVSYASVITNALQVFGYNKLPASLPNGLYTIKAPDQATNAYFSDLCISEDELATLYLTQRQQMGVASPKLAVCLFGDSRTAFTNSPAWTTCDAVPGAHFMLDAMGGSFYSLTGTGYAAPARRSLRQRFIKYAAAHYEQVVIWAAHGVNDIAGNGRAMSPSSPYGSWQDGATVIDMMLQEDREAAACANRHKVKLLIDTIWPHGVWLQSDPARNDIRQDYNEWRRSGWVSQGYDYQIDTAAWVPDGFTSFEECTIHAVQTGGNDTVLSDGIHWAIPGGVAASIAVQQPFIQSLLV